ncbi:MAG: T9SS type A sorting domain-containing protein [Saprospiraceae bacterium]|nr:T9SS type A sorting domain-containing protein [Saprospiraceae bacterium]
MNKRITPIAILTCLLLFGGTWTSKAQLNVSVTMSSVSVNNLCDLDCCGFLCTSSNCNPSDPRWEADVSDDYGNSDNFLEEVSDNNSPGTVSSGYNNALNFSASYDYCAPTSLDVELEAGDSDLTGWDAHDTRNTTIPVVAGTNTYQRTITVTGTPCGTVVWRFNFRVVVTGSAEGCGDDCVDAIDITPTSTPGCGNNPRSPGNGLANLNLDFRSGGPVSPTTSSTVGAPAPPCGNFGSGRRDVWFRATIPAGRTGLDFSFDNNGGCGTFCSTNISYAVYSGSCGSLVLESCDEVDCPAAICSGKKMSIFGNPGETKFIRVWEEDNQGFELDFRSSGVQGICNTPGDDCVGANVLPQPGEFVCASNQPADSIVNSGFPTLNHTNSNGIRPGPSLTMIGSDAPDCWDDYHGSGNDAHTREDVWLQLELPNNTGGALIEFTNNGGCEADPGNVGACQTNISYAWYTSSNNSCSGLEYRGCGAVSCFIGCSSGEIQVDGRPNETVWVRIWEGDNQGFNISINDITSTAPADQCYTALPLGPQGCNYQATSLDNGPYAEPDIASWVSGAHPGGVCQDGDSDPSTGTFWGTMDNMVWHTFTQSTTEDFSIAVTNMTCVGGGATAQLAVFTNNGTPQSPTCDLATETGMGCATGVGNVQLDITNLPAGEYILVVDGNAGAECTWEFRDEIGGDLLPIELKSFEGIYNKSTNAIDLTWFATVNAEVEGFAVERSLDAINFEQIGVVNSKYNLVGTDAAKYSFSDPDYPNAQVVYYRLQELLYTGEGIHTNIVAVSPDQKVAGVSLLQDIYPNPASTKLTIPFLTAKEDKVSAVIYDIRGQEMMRVIDEEVYGMGQHQVTAYFPKHWPSGVYILRFTANNRVVTSKFVIQP